MQKDKAMRWVICSFCCLPLAVTAYVGSFSRLIRDDYSHLAIGRDLGPWQGMLYWRDHFNGSFSIHLLYGLVAPLEGAAPAIMPALILLIWLVALSWLLTQALAVLRLEPGRHSTAVALAGLTIAAAVHGFYTLESIYWLSGNARYTLPVAVLTLYLAASFAAVRRLRNPAALALLAMVGGLVCFFNAAFAESYAAFQLMALAILLAIAPLLLGWRSAKVWMVIAACGLGATVASAVAMLSAPGMSARIGDGLARRWAYPIRYPIDLAERSLLSTFQFLGHQDAFAGFMLLFGSGLFLALTLCKPRPSSSSKKPSAPTASLRLICFAQLCFLPILLSHRSDNPQLLGSFSYAYFTVVVLCVLQFALFSMLLFKKPRAGLKVFHRTNGMMLCTLITLLAVILFFAMTQFRSIHFTAATYLFLSALVWQAALCWQLIASRHDPRATRFGLCASLYSAFAILSFLPPVILGQYTYGTVFLRTLSHASFLLVSSGLLWGALLGYLIKRHGLGLGGGCAWIARFKVMAVTLAVSLCIGMVTSKASMLPGFAKFATEWQARHEALKAHSAAGRREATVPAFSYDFHGAITQHDASNDGMHYARRYYDLDSIQVLSAGAGD